MKRVVSSFACAALLACVLPAALCAQGGVSGAAYGQGADAVSPVALNKLWTLNDCIDYAIEHNITIKQSENDLQTQEVTLLASKTDMLPSLSGRVTEAFSFGRGVDEDNINVNANTTTTGFSLGGDATVFGGLKKMNTIKQNQINLKASTATLQNAKNTIKVSVAQAFVKILYDKSILELAQEQIVKDSLQMVRLQEMYRYGKASSSEVSSQRSTFFQSKLSRTEAESNLNLDLLALTQLLEIRNPEGFDIAVPDTSLIDVRPLMKPEEIYNLALKIRPEVAADSLRLVSEGYNVKIAKAGYMPTLSLSGSIGSNFYTNTLRSTTPFADQMSNNFNQYIGLTLSIPIFNRWQTVTSVKKSKLAVHKQELTLENTRKTLYKDIQQSWYNAANSQSKFISSREAAASAKESFDLTLAKYDAGKADINEYNTSRTQYLTAASELEKARYEMLFNVRLLEFYATGDLGL